MSVNGQRDHDMSDGAEAVPMSRRIEAAMNRGVRDALRRHKLLGESIAVMRDGKVVVVPPEEIVVPDLPDNDPTPAP